MRRLALTRAVALRAPFAQSRALASSPIAITNFKQLTPFVKRIILRVHPDVVATAADEVIATNEGSLQDLFRLLDGLKVYCEAPDVASLGSTEPSLRPLYRLAFFHYARAAGKENDDPSLRVLERAAVDVAVPSLLVERCRILARKGHHSVARALYMRAALGAVGDVGRAVGLPLPLSLGPPHAALLAEVDAAEAEKGAGRKPVDNWATAEASLLSHLKAQGPLQQGKGTGGGGPVRVEDGMSPSVFSRTAVTRAVERFIARPGALRFDAALQPPAARAAVSRLRAMLTAFHDPLMLYHTVWTTIGVAFGPPTGEQAGGGGYWASPATRTFTLPSDFTVEGAVELLGVHVPTLATATTKTAGRANARRA